MTTSLRTPRGRPRGTLLLGAALLVGAPASAHAQAPVTAAVDAVVGVQVGVSTGTGFVTDRGILTAAHVVADARDVVVRWQGTDRPGRVVRTDPVLDLALVAADVAAAPLRLDVAPELGEPVTVVAYDPFGGPVLTRGIVSALPREFGLRLLQIDAAVNPGTSGGPVLGDDGRVLGLVITKDVLRDDVGRAHLSSDLDAFLAGEPTTSSSAVPVADRAGPQPAAAPISPLAPAAVASAVLLLGVIGALRSRPPRPATDLKITLGPPMPVDDEDAERFPT